MKFRRVLVTGGAGFIGSHTVDLLMKRGAEVWVLDDMSSGSLPNLSHWRGNQRLHVKVGTVLNYKLLEQMSQKVDAILHLAALVSPTISVRNPEQTNAVNVTGTLNVLRAAKESDLQRVVFASSSSVYGRSKNGRITEDAQLNPISPYGVSKLAAEKYCKAYYEMFDLPTISLRYFNVYGERQSANPYSGVIAIFARNILQGRRPTIFGDGKQTRDFIHVSDVAKANVLALETERGLGEAFNIGTGLRTSILELATALARISGRPGIRPIFDKPRIGDIKHSCANPSKARRVLRFVPAVGLTSGLARLTHWMKKGL